jgi:anhydro-N-acetylmuramic acid kinase
MPDEYYIGLISGTSMDGIDAALVQFHDHELSVSISTKLDYPDELRESLFKASRKPETCTVDVLGQLNTRVGECFRDAALGIVADSGLESQQVRAIGSHGQTIRHRPDATHPFTLQIGDPSIIATGSGIDTVADFRLSDMALGGEGAPLAPAFHEWLFRTDTANRVVLNLGGIANITVLPAADGDVSGFDTGPANTLLDAWIHKCKGADFDADGQWAASGNVNEAILRRWLSDEWLLRAGPKSTGFEYFNLDWMAGKDVDDARPEDVQATLAELTAVSIADAIKKTAPKAREIFVCGGGAHNSFLLQRIATLLPGISLSSTAAAGLAPDDIEAVAFAWLAMRRLERLPGNLPRVTGASRNAILGAVFKA